MKIETRIALTISDAVAYSGIGRSSLYKLFSEGKIVPRKVGKRTLILKAELDAFVNSLPSGVYSEK